MKTGLSRLGLLLGAGFFLSHFVNTPLAGIHWEIAAGVLVFSAGLGWLAGWLIGWALEGFAKSKKGRENNPPTGVSP